MSADVTERGGERRRRQSAPPRSHHLAAETKPAIDRASVDDFQQHPIGIAVDDPLDGAECVIADRIAAVLRTLLKLARLRHELPRDRIEWIVGVNDVEHRRRDGDRIAGGHFGKFIDTLARDQPVFAKLVSAPQSRRGGFHGSGFHSTWSIRVAPVASMTKRSRPSASRKPAASSRAQQGNPRRADNARHKCAPSQPSPVRAAGAARPASVNSPKPLASSTPQA